ncbi:MAG: hypothetical protein K2H85_02955 [Allobaculum sp.]|nr:hypothetical protein [Allobaculum sp.]
MSLIKNKTNLPQSSSTPPPVPKMSRKEKKALKKATRTKRPFYKKWWVWGVAAFVGIGVIGSNGAKEETPTQPVAQVVETEESNQDLPSLAKPPVALESSEATGQESEVQPTETPESSPQVSEEVAAVPEPEVPVAPIEPEGMEEMVDETPVSPSTPEPTVEPVPSVALNVVPIPGLNLVNPSQATYILNTNTHKYHYPDCNSVDKIAEEHYYPTDSQKVIIESSGFVSCKKCNP